MRRQLEAHGFLEVETPMLQPVYGGAAARPFRTHHNTLDIGLYLRIAPELYLKRLVVGGLERVYEINRNFRNEGISTRHNPEFTMLEFYQAYTDYLGMMDLSEELLRQAAIDATGSAVVEYQGEKIDFGNFRRVSMRDAVGDPSLKGKALVDEFERNIESTLIQPTIVFDYPIEVSPLSKNKPGDPDFVERFEIYVAGMEIANAFTELNDPAEQRRRFEMQLALREKGDEEAHQMDEDYVRALSYGMPPTGGEGIGIDRVTMILTNTRSIRDVILFPLLRPVAQASGLPNHEHDS
jgi:lysyl-tRNA synthetase class 2